MRETESISNAENKGPYGYFWEHQMFSRNESSCYFNFRDFSDNESLKKSNFKMESRFHS